MNNSVFLLATSALMAACGTTDKTPNTSAAESPVSLAPTTPVTVGRDSNNQNKTNPKPSTTSGEGSAPTPDRTANSGTATPPTNGQPDALADVQCFGINSCSPYAMCAVTQADIEATKNVFGDKYAMSEVHACAGLGRCAAAEGQLNWVKVSQQECGERGGFLIVTNDNGGKAVQTL
jgi:hypothetical protein